MLISYLPQNAHLVIYVQYILIKFWILDQFMKKHEKTTAGQGLGT